MPAAVSFSKLRIVWRCVVQPSDWSEQPHRRSDATPWSPRDMLSITSGAVGRSEESRRPSGGSEGGPSEPT
jgi:hypothetical protein